MAKNQKEEEVKSTTEEKKSKKINPIIIIVLALVVIGAGSFGGFYLFMQNKDKASTTVVETKVAIADGITVNLNDADGKRYLKASVYISYDASDKKSAEEVTAKQVEIKDRTIFYLKSRVAKDFDASNEAKLKGDLVIELNKIMTEGKIINVYFPGDLLIQ